MLGYSQPISEIIRQRFSCRMYLSRPIDEAKRQRLQEAMVSRHSGPLGAPLRFELIVASEEDATALKGLGTYGLIRGMSGFIVGAVGAGSRNLEDEGYVLEELILLATDLGLGTCWVGGLFSRSSFARRMALAPGEQMPAVVTIGDMANPEQARNSLIRWQVRANARLPWERLFFGGRFGVPLTREQAGAYATPLEMVRLGPSGSNKQPWRIVRLGQDWHFYLQRTKGYPGGLATRIVQVADIQRLDMGIAMCHFELTARELGLSGRWVIQEPAIAKPDTLTEYTVSWVG